MAQKQNIRQMSPRSTRYRDLDTLGNLAVAPRAKAQPQYRPPAGPQPRPAQRPRPTQPRPAQKRAVRTEPVQKKGIAFVLSPSAKFVLVCGVLLFFAISLAYVARLSTLAANNTKIGEMQAQLHEQQLRGEDLQLKYASATNLEKVMQIAENDLGMGYPENGQIREVALHIPSENENAVAQDEENDANRVTAMLNRLKELLQ
ncbi:MAG: hypothetical protein ACOX88_02250 [Christensenellales bacterium]|jgi:cell division protein FtsL